MDYFINKKKSKFIFLRSLATINKISVDSFYKLLECFTSLIFLISKKWFLSTAIKFNFFIILFIAVHSQIY